MPYKQEWFPAPQNLNLPVLKEKPKGIYRESGFDVKTEKFYHHCRFCEGWIEGQPNRYHEDTIGPLCGRRGTSEYCARCGKEIGFFGMMS